MENDARRETLALTLQYASDLTMTLFLEEDGGWSNKEAREIYYGLSELRRKL